MQNETFDAKKAFKTITEGHDQQHITSAISAAAAQFAWYAIYFVYLPEHRLLLFIWQFLIMLLPILVSVNRKKLGLNSAQCNLFSILLIATLAWCLINICPAEIRIVVFLGVSMLFLGPGFLAYWPMRYYLYVVAFSVILNIVYFVTVGKLSFQEYLFNNIFPSTIVIMIGAFLLNSRMVNMIKKERIKWSLEQSEKELSMLNKKTKAELDFLIYSISHDLRSPILSVKGLLMLINQFEKLNPQQCLYLKMAESSTDRLDQTIYDMLDFADNATIELKSESFNIRVMVQEIFDDLKFLAKVPIDFQINIAGSDIVYADRKRIKTIIKNLASNAVKYSRKEAKDSFVKFKLQEDSNNIVFEIADNGRGIPKEEQEKIYQMFYRATTDSTGSGLGLFIVKEVLSKIGGTISLKSTSSEGSVFKVNIPNSNFAENNEVEVPELQSK
jgi:signal transduction histidine kinase